MVGALFYLFPIVGQMVGVPVVCINPACANGRRSSCLYPIQRVQMVGVPV